ncbi:MAG: hypothetical protein WA103_04855 [Minisyncoccales bacterium]
MHLFSEPRSAKEHLSIVLFAFRVLVGRLFEQANGRTCLVSGSCTLSRKIFKQQAFGCFNRKIGIWPGFCPAVYCVCGITAGRLPANGDNLL